MTFSTTEGGDGAPPEPDWSQFYADEFDIVEAHDQWMAIINEMREANTLTVANGHQVKRLVEFSPIRAVGEARRRAWSHPSRQARQGRAVEPALVGHVPGAGQDPRD